MLTNLQDLLADAERGGYAVGAFNVTDLNQATAVLDAAQSEHSPAIVQVIAGMHPYANEEWWWRRLRELIESYPQVPVCLHLDHGPSYSDCMRALACGFTGIMIDGSRDETGQPASAEYNRAITSEVVKACHAAGVGVEGELGTIGGAEDGVAGSFADIQYTDPAEAAGFVAATGVDALAVAVGTTHGTVKFTGDHGRQTLRLELIDQIKQLVGGTFLVLHGSSSIPAEAVAIINEHGGAVTPSYGLDAEQKRSGIAHGIRKINQGNDSHLWWTAAARRYLDEHQAEVNPAGELAAGMRAMSAIIAERMREFGSSGKA